jgi:hypothetical protein
LERADAMGKQQPPQHQHVPKKDNNTVIYGTIQNSNQNNNSTRSSNADSSNTQNPRDEFRTDANVAESKQTVQHPKRSKKEAAGVQEHQLQQNHHHHDHLPLSGGALTIITI